jgi:hypothetical protein
VTGPSDHDPAGTNRGTDTVAVHTPSTDDPPVREKLPPLKDRPPELSTIPDKPETPESVSVTRAVTVTVAAALDTSTATGDTEIDANAGAVTSGFVFATDTLVTEPAGKAVFPLPGPNVAALPIRSVTVTGPSDHDPAGTNRGTDTVAVHTPSTDDPPVREKLPTLEESPAELLSTTPDKAATPDAASDTLAVTVTDAAAVVTSTATGDTEIDANAGAVTSGFVFATDTLVTEPTGNAVFPVPGPNVAALPIRSVTVTGPSDHVPAGT